MEPILDVHGPRDRWQQRSYSIYGLNLGTDFPFRVALIPGKDPTDIVFTCVDSPPLAGVDWQSTPPLCVTHLRNSDQTEVSYYAFPGCSVVRFSRVGSFHLWPGRIMFHTGSSATRDQVEAYLLNRVLALALESRGVPALHASAVVLGDRSVAILSGKGHGKSTLAGALVQSGSLLLTDDLLPISCRNNTFSAQPSYPQIRMWPAQAEHFLGHTSGLEPVWPGIPKLRVPVGAGGFGSFCEEPMPLACILVPERCAADAQISIEALSPRDALIQMLRFSVLAHVAEAFGWQPLRLRFLARLAQGVPFFRLSYPSGFEHLTHVCDLIREHVSRLGEPR